MDSYYYYYLTELADAESLVLEGPNLSVREVGGCVVVENII